MRSLYLWLLRKKEYPEVYDFGWWFKVGFLTNTLAIVNETRTRLQGDENKIVTKMMRGLVTDSGCTYEEPFRLIERIYGHY